MVYCVDDVRESKKVEALKIDGVRRKDKDIAEVSKNLTGTLKVFARAERVSRMPEAGRPRDEGGWAQ